MSASDAFETAVLKLYFQNVGHAGIGDATGLVPSTAAGSFWISLHTADPGETGTAVTSETAYTNYTRVAVPRSTAGFTVAGTAPTTLSNAAIINFPACGATGATLTHFGIVSTASGAGTLHFSGALTAPLAVSNGITPSFAIGALTTTAD